MYSGTENQIYFKGISNLGNGKEIQNVKTEYWFGVNQFVEKKIGKVWLY
jgi:hypothetical protein